MHAIALFILYCKRHLTSSWIPRMPSVRAKRENSAAALLILALRTTTANGTWKNSKSETATKNTKHQNNILKACIHVSIIRYWNEIEWRYQLAAAAGEYTYIRLKKSSFSSLHSLRVDRRRLCPKPANNNNFQYAKEIEQLSCVRNPNLDNHDNFMRCLVTFQVTLLSLVASLHHFTFHVLTIRAS